MNTWTKNYRAQAINEHIMLVEEQWERKKAELEMHTCYSQSLLLACHVAA